jgi:hypothetical protein
VDIAQRNLNRNCAAIAGAKQFRFGESMCGGTAMNQLDEGFDYPRYRKLLAEAVDEPKRLALIKILIEERARDRLAAQLSSAIIRTVLAPRGAQDASRR